MRRMEMSSPNSIHSELEVIQTNGNILHNERQKFNRFFVCSSICYHYYFLWPEKSEVGE